MYKYKVHKGQWFDKIIMNKASGGWYANDD